MAGNFLLEYIEKDSVVHRMNGAAINKFSIMDNRNYADLRYKISYIFDSFRFFSV